MYNIKAVQRARGQWFDLDNGMCTNYCDRVVDEYDHTHSVGQRDVSEVDAQVDEDFYSITK